VIGVFAFRLRSCWLVFSSSAVFRLTSWLGLPRPAPLLASSRTQVARRVRKILGCDDGRVTLQKRRDTLLNAKGKILIECQSCVQFSAQ
jgi:hypothetical protein